MVLPGEFVHLAEDTGLVVPIGAWTIATVCHQLMTWNTANGRTPTEPGAMRCSINLSSRQLGHGATCRPPSRPWLAETGVNPRLALGSRSPRAR